ncbi:MAG: hypothetical protein NT155_01895 [Candidatus Staskawiczbacteria bacterium]|nr:hypothetical protein [Candidatus Staskawiczbacteria bacterium]
MDIKKCDLCKKKIEGGDGSVYVRFASFDHADLCEECASPVYKFLQKNKFLDKKQKNIKKS